ncbi:unnamed protein product [Calypogeia fissa]
MYVSFIIELSLLSFLPGPSFSIGMSKEISKGGENPLLDGSEGFLDVDNIDVATQLLIDELIVTDPTPNESGDIYEFLVEYPNFTRTVVEGGENRSAHVDKWARERLSRFKEFKKLRTESAI